MKSVGKTIVLLTLGILLAACSLQSEERKKGELVRIDVQQVEENGTKSEEQIVTDPDDLDAARKAIGNTEWRPNKELEMKRAEDTVATFFYRKDENMPESLTEYRIWFEEDDSATLFSNDEEERYGKLNPENGQILKNLFWEN